MNTTRESKVASSIFIGRWTPKVLFSLEESPIGTGSCADGWVAFHNECSPGRFAMGKTLPQERERRSATSRNRNRIKAESFVGTYLPARSTASKG